MELGLGGQPRPLPARVGGRLGLGDPHRPSRRQRHRLEHPPPPPRAVFAHPEGRMPDPGRPAPRPVRRGPPAPVVVAARLDELEERLVGHVVPIDGERGHVHDQGRELVVPPERDLVAPGPQRGPAGGHQHPVDGRRRPARVHGVGGGPALQGRGQPVPHVGQGLLVQLLVLDHGEHGLAAVQDRVPLLLDVGVLQRVHDQPVGLGRVLPDRLAAGPRRDRSAVGGGPVLGIDAAGEEGFQPGVDPRPPQPALDERVDAEGGDVPLVEHHGMTEGYRLLVVGVGGQQVEEAGGPAAGVPVPGDAGFPLDHRLTRPVHA